MADRQPPPAEKQEPLTGKYNHKRDYFRLPRFRPDFGVKHNLSTYWEKKLGDRNKPAREGDDA